MTDRAYRGKRWAETRAYILRRDAWVCQLCGGYIDPMCPRNTARSPVVDHIVPVLAGGDWHDPANLRAAHMGCNSARADHRRRRPRTRYPLPRIW